MSPIQTVEQANWTKLNIERHRAALYDGTETFQVVAHGCPVIIVVDHGDVAPTFPAVERKP